MLLSEPPQSNWDLNFSLFGTPVRIHPLFWLSGVILNLRVDRVDQMLIWLVAFTLSILVHEMGHAIAGRLDGRSPSITLYTFGGLTSFNSGYYGRASRARTEVLISFAGPLAGFLLALAILSALYFSGYAIGPVGDGLYRLVIVPAEEVVSRQFTYLIDSLLVTSIFWGILNLAPIYPLDGGQIARELLLWLNPRDGLRQSLVLSITMAVVLAAVSLVEWRSLLGTLLFGMLAYESYLALNAYRGRDPW